MFSTLKAFLNPYICINSDFKIMINLLLRLCAGDRVKSTTVTKGPKIYSDTLKITQERVLMRSARINLSKDFVVQQLHWWPNRKSDNKFYSSTTA